MGNHYGKIKILDKARSLPPNTETHSLTITTHIIETGKARTKTNTPSDRGRQPFLRHQIPDRNRLYTNARSRAIPSHQAK